MNAIQARKISFRNMVKRDKGVISKINEEIENATQKGKTSIYVFRYTDKFDEEKISYYTSLGFSIFLESDGKYKLCW